jgi:homoserine O-acetyltransferase/O-succinyltransferase
MRTLRLLTGIALFVFALPALAADYPTPREGEWVAHDFKFHTGETLAALKLHYTTVGDPAGIPVIMLHGTSGSAAGLLTPAFAGELFGQGQPLDASKYFIVLPDAIGHGKSSKPSDGLRTKFPLYDYSDMVEAQYRLLTEALGIKHVRLVTGNSMGGMHTWLWGEKYPDYMDILVPMAAQPTPMASRNWMLRRMMIEIIRNDPEYNNGDYTQQPQSLRRSATFYGIATAGGTLRYQDIAPTREKADQFVDARLAAPFGADANDWIWQWSSSADYDAMPEIGKVRATVLAINAADDERNPPETGVMQEALNRVPNAKLYLIPASTRTSGHATTGDPKFYKDQLQEVLQKTPRKTM